MWPNRTSKRTYIDRLMNDPRSKAMRDGWVAQATAEAEMRYPHALDARPRAAMAAERALDLGMSFVLDNDAELAAVRRELEEMTKRALDLLNTRCMPGVFVKGHEEPDAHS